MIAFGLMRDFDSAYRQTSWQIVMAQDGRAHVQLAGKSGVI